MTHRLLHIALFPMLCALPLVAACGGDDGDDGDDTPPPLTCAEVDLTQPAQEMPEKGEEVTLSGVYKIDSRYIYDGGETVTIEPGTIFLMGPDSRLYTGWRSDPATIYAKGTAEAPILFCGSAAADGHWQDVQLLTGTTTDSYLEHVRIENAGGSSTSDAEAALEVSVPVRLSNVAVIGSTKLGMTLGGLGDGSENLTVTGGAAETMEIRNSAAITNLPEGDYTGNASDVILVKDFSSTQVHFKNRGVPYRQTNDRIVFGSAGGEETWIRLDAGVEYQFCQDCNMLLGWRGDPGAIYAEGTADEPIVFTSSQESPAAGDWDGIQFLSGMKSDSVMDHVRVEYGGKSDGAAIYVSGGKGKISNTVIANSAGAGIEIDGDRDAGLTIDEATITYEGNASDLVE